MSVPRRAVAIAGAAQKLCSVSRSTATLHVLRLFPAASLAARAPTLLVAPRLGAGAATLSAAPACRRWYSANDQPIGRSWTYDEIKKQLQVNEALRDSGEGQEAQSQKAVVFVDVREPEELLTTGKIPGAINIPVTSAVQSFHVSDEDFADMHGFERPPKDANLVFYCKAGVRAKTAAGLARHAGWTNIGDYPGSWLDWDAQNGPVEHVKRG